MLLALDVFFCRVVADSVVVSAMVRVALATMGASEITLVTLPVVVAAPLLTNLP